MKKRNKVIFALVIIFVFVFAIKWHLSWYIKGEISIILNGETVSVSECKIESITNFTDEGDALDWKFGEANGKLIYSVTGGTYGLYYFKVQIPQSLINGAADNEYVTYQFCCFANGSSKQKIDVDIQIDENNEKYITQVSMRNYAGEETYEQEIISNGNYMVKAGFGP